MDAGLLLFLSKMCSQINYLYDFWDDIFMLLAFIEDGGEDAEVLMVKVWLLWGQGVDVVRYREQRLCLQVKKTKM